MVFHFYRPNFELFNKNKFGLYNSLNIDRNSFFELKTPEFVWKFVWNK